MTATTLSPREMKRRRKQGADYVPPSPYTVKAALTHGDVFTKLSAVVISIPIAILFIVMQRFYQESMSGSVKG